MFSRYVSDDPLPQVKKKLVVRPQELEDLALYGTDFFSQDYLNELLANFWEGLEENNYYLIFYRITSTHHVERVNSQIRSGDFFLRGYVRVPKNNAMCSTFQKINSSIIKNGNGLLSALHGVCGQIATVYSLEKLGVLRPSLDAVFIDEAAMGRVTPLLLESPTGMSLKQMAKVHENYTGKKCQFYQAFCNVSSFRNYYLPKSEVRRLSRVRLKNLVRFLYDRIGNTDSSSYACSLGVEAKDPQKRTLLSHVEFIKRIRLDPRTDKTLVVTKNSLFQGNMKTNITRNGGHNYFLIDFSRPLCQLYKSGNGAVNITYAKQAIDRFEAICCPK
jgi:hypothetical protein